MVTLSRLSALLVSVLALAVFGPQFATSALDKFFPRPYIYYSAVLDNFITRMDEGGKHMTRDENGKAYPYREACRILPFQNIESLLRWNAFPETVAGRPVTHGEASDAASRIIYSPLVMKPSAFRLYAILESEPEGAQLSSAPDLFRMTPSRMEFIRNADNAIDEEKSRLHTGALRAAGFVFPARHIAHSPSTMKPYDNGILLADARNHLYHVHQIKGLPRVRDTAVTLPADTLKVQVLEQTRREYHALYSTPSGLCFLDWNAYAAKPLAHGPYATQTESLTADGDMLNWVFRVHNRDGVFVTATDRKLNPVRRLEWKVTDAEKAWRERRTRILSALFPFQVNYNDRRRSAIVLDVADIWARPLFNALGVIVTLALGTFLYRLKYKTLPRPADYLFLAVTGLYGLITCAILGPVVAPKKRAP